MPSRQSVFQGSSWSGAARGVFAIAIFAVFIVLLYWATRGF